MIKKLNLFIYNLEVLALIGLIGMDQKKFATFVKIITCNRRLPLIEQLQIGLSKSASLSRGSSLELPAGPVDGSATDQSEEEKTGNTPVRKSEKEVNE